MPQNGVLGSQQLTDIQIIDRTHPAIIKGMAARQDGRVLPRGRIVAKDKNGDMAAYEPGLASAGAWEATTAVVAGELKKPTVDNDHYYRCITGGNTGSGEPAWPTDAEATVADGTAEWEEAGITGVDDLTGGGVLADEIDTSVESVGRVIRHGTVVAENLDTAGAASAAADIAALEAVGVYAI